MKWVAGVLAVAVAAGGSRHPERSEEDMMIAAQAAFHDLWPCP
jgi:predicted nucleic acid-binding protein